MGSADWFARKLGGGAAPAPVSYPPPGTTQQQPVQRTVQPQVPQQQEEDTGKFYDVLQGKSSKSHGGQAARTEVESCPECGSGNYFSRSNAGVTPRKHCYECGYPLVQFGSETGEGGRQL